MPQYENMVQGRFLRRPNRFIAHVEIDGQEVICHVKNTGRCKELLTPNATVWCEKSQNPARKTPYSLIAVQKGKRCINMDSQIPNDVAEEWILQGGLGFIPKTLKREQFFGQSRFDFYLEDQKGQKGYLEVKGVTLEEANACYFPDAPTQRGARHLQELTRATLEGYRAFVLFVVQMEDVLFVSPNEKTDPAFAQALRNAHEKGVEIHAVTCAVTPDTIKAAAPLQVRL
ncbi:MAG: DNA/RNA nuclease SfsA [Oscillospiraceae bacterium]|nr:DNA/RNA nuclease SfsA [Oscillospiraceae bacterium]